MQKIFKYKGFFLLFASIFLFRSCTTETLRLDNYQVHGIDVSHYQRSVDWQEIANQEIDFAFVKATEGLTYKDSFFHRNWDGLLNTDIIRGAYHFYYPSLDPIQQAYNFIQTVELEHGDLPPVIDFETTNGKSLIEIVSGIQTWLTAVEQVYEIKPIIYTNQKLYHKYIKGHFDDYKVWVARYNDYSPEMDINQNWTFWQYGDRGRLEGIKGNVDFNVFYSDLETLQSLTLDIEHEDCDNSTYVYPL